MDKQQEALIKAVIADFTKEKGKQPTNQKELTEYIKQKGGDKYLQSKLEGMAKKAAHGAKLEYIKSISHKCNDDEELVYFKRGGRVDCGCRDKKMKGGGKTTETTLKDMPWVAEFKAKRAKKKAEEEARKKAEEAQRKRDIQFADDYNEGYSHVEKNKGVKKNCFGTKIKIK